MRFIYTLEEKKFKEEKEKENEVLRAFGVDEETIQSIYEYDKEMFNKNRSFRTNEVYLEEYYHHSAILPNGSLIIYDTHPFETEEDIEFGLQLLYPHYVVAQIDSTTLQVLLLRLNGYTAKEIGEQMHLKTYQVEYVLKKLRKLFKKVYETYLNSLTIICKGKIV